MSYTTWNFKTKTALKQAVLAHHETGRNPVRCYNPVQGPDLSDYTGTVYLEGPHYPQPHKWYAQAEMKSGVVVKVK